MGIKKPKWKPCVSLQTPTSIQTYIPGRPLDLNSQITICLLFIPFLLVDLVVSAVLLSAGMMMLPPSIISLPFKIILFVLVDGWRLLTETLVRSFN